MSAVEEAIRVTIGRLLITKIQATTFLIGVVVSLHQVVPTRTHLLVVLLIVKFALFIESRPPVLPHELISQLLLLTLTVSCSRHTEGLCL